MHDETNDGMDEWKRTTSQAYYISRLKIFRLLLPFVSHHLMFWVHCNFCLMEWQVQNVMLCQ